MTNPRWTHDRRRTKGYSGVVGVDEAGRGCLAGPVVAGCVILTKEFFSRTNNRKRIENINDSKKFNELTRNKLFELILQLMESEELFGATGSASVLEIEEHNIVGATCLAMTRAMDSASYKSHGKWKPVHFRNADLFDPREEEEIYWPVFVDGRLMKRLPYRHEGMIKGDTISLAVAMASLLAKVTRDRMMTDLNDEFPAYGFSSHKGYGVPVHVEALQKYGPTPHHRPRFLQNILNLPIKKVPSTFEQTRLSLV